jgi:hypothetical protein
MSSLQVPASLHRQSSSQALHLQNAYDSLPEVLPVNMTSAAPSRSLTTSSNCDNKDLAGLALLLGDPLDFQNCPTPSPTSQRDGMRQAALAPAPSEMSAYGPLQNRSIYSERNQHLPYNPRDSVSELSQCSQNLYGPSPLLSDVSSPLHHRQSALSILSSTTGASGQHCQSYSNHYPGQLVWTNSSSTTISIASPDFYDNHSLAQPIAELDTSPYQMVPIVGVPNNHDSSREQKLAVQVNTTPVELPAEESQTAKPTLRRQTRPGSWHGRAFSEPVSSLYQQHEKRPY